MTYKPTIQTSCPRTLQGLQPGQWVSYEGAIGRYMGWRNGCIWIAWGGTARHRFKTFAQAFHA